MKTYIQTTSFTTAAAELLSVLHHLKQIPLTKDNEFRIWQFSVNLPTRGSSIYGLARFAKMIGLDPEVLVESTEYNFPDYRFYRYTKEDIEHAKFSETQHLKRAIEKRIRITETEINLQMIQQKLKDNFLILRLNTKPIRLERRNTSNYVVVVGCDKNNYHLMDPATGGISVPRKVMKKAFESLQTKKYRDHRMIAIKK